MTNHRSSWLGDFSLPACFLSQPHDFTHSRWIISKCQLHFTCAHPAVRITESHHVRPARCRGQLPRVTVSSPPAAAENTFANCLFVRRSGSPIATEFGHADYDFFEPHSLCFPLFWGNHFSTDFRLPLWALSHNDPVHAVCWGFRLSYCVNWLFTSSSYCVNWLFTSSTSSRVISSCSTEH